jgi:uncharacterized protein DUF3147
MLELLFRFLVGGVFVSLFAALSDLFKPQSFAGLFGAAPSIALATLGLAILQEGPGYAAIEAHSMVPGAIAFVLYAACASWLIMGRRVSALAATILALVAWAAAAFGLWMAWWARA